MEHYLGMSAVANKTAAVTSSLVARYLTCLRQEMFTGELSFAVALYLLCVCVTLYVAIVCYFVCSNRKRKLYTHVIYTLQT